MIIPSPRDASRAGTTAEVDSERQAAVVAEVAALALEAVAAEEVLATAAATQETGRAADAARSTRDARAFAALVTAEQKSRTADQVADLEEHERATLAREDRATGRVEEVEEILAAADERDSRAELRDRVADERESAASLRSFLGDQQEEYDHHAAGLLVRRAAAMDRSDAKTDRASAAADRAQLTAPPSPGSGVGGFSEGALTTEGAGDLSHDVRVPLSSIIARVEMLEVALRESDDRLRFLVDAVTEYAIITLDPDGIIESWNTGAELLKGYTSEQALGRHFSIFYPAEDRDTGLPQRLLDRARAEGSTEHTGWRVRKDGSQFWGDVVISAVHNDAGILTGFVKVVRDLTEQHRLEVAQDSFYSAFKHDFRVPITAIKGFAELITDADPHDQDYLVERVDSNANRMLSMAEELVDYARLRSGLIPISLEVVDMMTLAQLAVANLASIAEASRVQVTAADSVKVFADPAALERVIANLVTNALKYSPAESEIHLICEGVEGVGVLRIVDRGRGIDERDLGSIFMEFERGRLAQDDSGTGLGLASVQRLIGLQDGTVELTSQVDVGTTVTIQLPLAP